MKNRNFIEGRTATILPILIGAFFLGSTQNLFASNMTAIAKAFNIEAQRDLYLGGYMSTAFFLVGAPTSVIFGMLVDSVRRVEILSFLLLMGAVSMIVSATTSSFWILLLMRVVLGTAVGGLSPLVFSVIGDLYTANERPSMTSYVGLIIGAGAIVGQVVAGIFASYGWRLPLIVVGSACLITSFVIYSIAREPERGLADKINARSSGHNVSVSSSMTQLPDRALGAQEKLNIGAFMEKIRTAFSNMGPQARQVLVPYTTRAIYVQSIFGTIPWSVITVFLTDFLSQEKGMTVPQATFLVTLFGIGAAVGGIAGGAIGKALYARNAALVPSFFGLVQASSCFPLIYILNAETSESAISNPSLTSTVGSTSSPVFLYAVTFLAGLIASTTGPNLKAILLNISTPETRGMVFTLQYLADSLSKGIAPFAIGMVISMFGKDQRTYIFTMAMFFWIISGLIIFFTSHWVEADEKRAKETLTSQRKE